MNREVVILLCSAFAFFFTSQLKSQVNKWEKLELTFTSDSVYDNPLYEVEQFLIHLESPTGRELTLNGFWDGGHTWKFRFAPDETGTWTFATECSDRSNSGLHDQSGSFECTAGTSDKKPYTHGPVIHPIGTYHLAHADGTPFLWIACTAWNGALKSTEEEWDTYLQHRRDHNYTVIQFVTTQWRGCAANRLGQKAFTGSGRIEINPEFFQYLDEKVDKINDYDLVAAPVLLWALPFGDGRELSPGFYLPIEAAVKLARYIVARYQGNQVLWILGGDGRYYGPEEDRWRAIGDQVFSKNTPGLATLHPHGRSWVGDIYDDKPWYAIIGYQSSHSNRPGTVNWINKGPVAQQWDDTSPRPVINMEPNYEEIHFRIDAEDVRNASYWSIFATPIAGVTYGANGIWPWLREGENILNHEDAAGTHSWRESIDFPGSLQIGYLSAFLRQFEWWDFRPANQWLVEQPGDEVYNHFISLSKKLDHSVILAYIPAPGEVKIRNPLQFAYTGEWFNPATNKTTAAEVEQENGVIKVISKGPEDLVLVLRMK
jgi:hypothetical protein